MYRASLWDRQSQSRVNHSSLINAGITYYQFPAITVEHFYGYTYNFVSITREITSRIRLSQTLR